jgi:hypothetical protein
LVEGPKGFAHHTRLTATLGASKENVKPFVHDIVSIGSRATSMSQHENATMMPTATALANLAAFLYEKVFLLLDAADLSTALDQPRLY